MDSVQTRLDTARTELLDLGLRNPLINYKLLKARGIEVIDESLSDIYQNPCTKWEGNVFPTKA